MGKALFLAVSAGFFIAYAQLANALLLGQNSIITPISPVAENAQVDTSCNSFLLICTNPNYYTEFWNGVPVIGSIVEGVADTFDFATKAFGGFFQLITFQVPDAVGASIFTILIFVPLSFANGYIIFTAIRGGS